MQHEQLLTNNLKSKPLVTCRYGWKRTCVLYQDHIDVDGTLYELDDLVHVRSVYRSVMNIPSVRLELRFRKQDVVLRGIAAVEDARNIVEYLDTYCADTQHATSRLRWSRTRHSVSQPSRTPAISTKDALEALSAPLSSRMGVKTVGAVNRDMQEHAQAATAPVEAPDWLRDLDQHVVYTREQQRTKAHHSIRKYGFDVQMHAQDAEADTLPSIAVPVRLLPQETAHYCTNATLASESPIASQGQTARFTYTATDQGRLILTNTRMIYLGRTGQIVLDYNRLTHISRLRNAIAFSADHWSKRHVFEMDRPLECAMYLDSILRQLQRQQAQHEAQTAQPSPYQPALRRAQPPRTTHAKYAAYARQTMGIQPIKPALELADIETLPLTPPERAAMEIIE